MMAFCRPLSASSCQRSSCTLLPSARIQVCCPFPRGWWQPSTTTAILLPFQLASVGAAGCSDLLSGSTSTLLGVTPDSVLKPPCDGAAELHVGMPAHAPTEQTFAGSCMTKTLRAQDLGLQLLPELELHLARESRALADACNLPGMAVLSGNSWSVSGCGRALPCCMIEEIPVKCKHACAHPVS